MNHSLTAAFLFLCAVTTQAADVLTNGNTVTIRPDGGQAKVICLEVMNDNIIRVRATSETALPQKPASLMIVPQTAPAKGSYSVSEEGETVVVKAKNVKAVVAWQPSILAGRIPMDRGAWRAVTLHRAAKS